MNKENLVLPIPKIGSPVQKRCIAKYLGITPYELALKQQQRLAEARARGDIPDVLLLLQHPPVFTIGRFSREADILVSPEELATEGIAIFRTDRGGGVTYHGPGQLVGYPILHLSENGFGVREYIWKLEEAIIKLLLSFGIKGQRDDKYPGVWVDEKKVGSLGIHVSRYVTRHGFALNVNNDLRYFEYINPCGLQGPVMTSISNLLGYPIEVKAIIGNLLRAFAETFHLKCESGFEADPNLMATLGIDRGAKLPVFK